MPAHGHSHAGGLAMLMRRTRSFSSASRMRRAAANDAAWGHAHLAHPMRAETVQLGAGPRFPDRGGMRPDVFGRRRGDESPAPALAAELDDCSASMSRLGLLATDQTVPDEDAHDDAAGEGEAGEGDHSPLEASRALERALGESWGRLHGSRNMTAAFARVARSPDGAVRRAAVADPDFEPNPKELLRMQEKAGRRRSAPAIASEPPAFSTTMTARQAAATLETICREMACKVKRLFEDEVNGSVITLRVTRPGPRFGRQELRRVRAIVCISEASAVRTDVRFRRVAAVEIIRAPPLRSEAPGFARLTGDIRTRFQREWPRLVDALYVRTPA